MSLTIAQVSVGGTGVSTSTGSGSVVLSTSPTLVTPNLGTPSTLVGTNITGTASGLTAGNVTTNANLTGPVTSSGNATSVANNAITNAMLNTMAAHTYKGNNNGSPANASDITSTQLTADLNQFTSSLQGLVPGSGGGTSNFMRADGTWAVPPGSATGTVTSVAMSVPAFLSISGSPVTTSGTLAVSYSGTALPVANGGTGVTSLPTSASASAFAAWDSNVNMRANNFINAGQSTTAASGTTALTNASPKIQRLATGTGAQTYTMPDGSTIPQFTEYTFYIQSGATATIQSNTSAAIAAVAGPAMFSIINTSNSQNGAWSASDTVRNVSSGGTGAQTLTAHNLVIGNDTSAVTLLAPSSTSGVPLISQGSSADPAYGAVNLAGGSAIVTGVLPNANTTAASANTASAIVARDGSGNFTAGTITAALTGTASLATAPASGSAHGAVVLNSSGNFTSVAPSTSGNVLTSNGTDWVSQAAGGGGGSSPIGMIGNFPITNGDSYLTSANWVQCNGQTLSQTTYATLYGIVGLIPTTLTSWTAVTHFTASSLNGVATNGAGNLYAVCGAGGLIYSSTNLSSWTSRTSGTSSALNGMAYGASVFCAVGAGGVILSSTDATTWTSRTSGTTSAINIIVFQNSLFLAGAAGGAVLSSTNAVTWTVVTSATTGTSTSISAIGYGLGLYYAGGVTNALITSTNLSTWSAATILGSGTAGVQGNFSVFNSKIFVSATNSTFLLTSTNGTSWTPISLGPIASSNGGATAVINGNLYVLTSQLFTSTDGVYFNYVNPITGSYNVFPLNNLAVDSTNVVAVSSVGGIQYASASQYSYNTATSFIVPNLLIGAVPYYAFSGNFNSQAPYIKAL